MLGFVEILGQDGHSVRVSSQVGCERPLERTLTTRDPLESLGQPESDRFLKVLGRVRATYPSQPRLTSSTQTLIIAWRRDADDDPTFPASEANFTGRRAVDRHRL